MARNKWKSKYNIIKALSRSSYLNFHNTVFLQRYNDGIKEVIIVSSDSCWMIPLESLDKFELYHKPIYRKEFHFQYEYDNLFEPLFYACTHDLCKYRLGVWFDKESFENWKKELLDFNAKLLEDRS